MTKQVFLMILAAGLLAGCAHHKKTVPPAATSGSRSYYTKPLTTPGSRYSSLPGSVQATLLAEVGTAEVANVVKEINAGRVCYKVYFMDPITYPPIFIGADGSVLNPDMTVAVPAPRDDSLIKYDDLPVSVTRAVVERVPDAATEVKSSKLELWGDHKVYVVTFKHDIEFPTLYIVADGPTLIPAH